MAVNYPIRHGFFSLIRSERNTKEKMMKRLVIGLFAAAVLCFAATGCHTVRGAGEDISTAGQTIQNNTP